MLFFGGRQFAARLNFWKQKGVQILAKRKEERLILWPAIVCFAARGSCTITAHKKIETFLNRMILQLAPSGELQKP